MPIELTRTDVPVLNALLKDGRKSFYQITSKGLEVYSKWVKDFLEFVRSADI